MSAANHYHYHNAPKRKYGLGKFIIDALLTVFTGGLYLIYVFIREMRNR